MDPDIDLIIGEILLNEIPDSVIAPFSYLDQLAGNNQNMRYQFLVAFNRQFFVIKDEKVLSEIGSVIAIFHSSSLLIDDIEDSSTVRRGFPCAHLKYGVPLTINAGNLMYFMALNRAVTSLPNIWLNNHPKSDSLKVQSEAYTILVDEMLNLHVGQGLDIYWRDNLYEIWSDRLPTISEYLDMVKNKTGGLFRLLVKLLALFSDGDFDLSRLIALANLLGIIYQIRDDYLNLVDQRYSEMKGMAGEDLVEGKLSLPVLYSLYNSTEKSPVHEVLLDLETSEERQAQPQRVSAAIAYLKQDGSIKYTYDLLQKYVARALKMIEASGGDSGDLEKIVLHFGDVVKP